MELSIVSYQKWDRNLNIFLALTTSASVGAWAVWGVFPYVWASIIGLAQVVAIVRPILKHNNKIKEYSKSLPQVKLLNIEYDKLWNHSQKGTLSDAEIYLLFVALRKKEVEVFTFSPDIITETSKKIKDKANYKMKIFLKNNYGIEIDISK